MAENDLNPDNVFVFGSDLDAIWLAPVGTPLPTTFDGPLDAAFENVGWLDPAGIGTSQTGSLTKLRGHQGGRVLRTISTEPGVEYTWTAFETKGLTLSIADDEDTITNTLGVRESNFGPDMKVSRFAAVIDLRDRGNTDAGIRLAIARFEVSATGERTATNEGIYATPMTGEITSPRSQNKRWIKSLGE